MNSSNLNLAYLFRLAWRDSRKNRTRLLVFMSAVILGIASLTALNSFRTNLQKDIDKEAQTLLGADLVIQARQLLTPEIQSFIDSVGMPNAREVNFASMIFFPKNKGTRLVQVRALEGNFPFYGNLETEPIEAQTTFRNGQKALLDHTVMLQFDAQKGDKIRLGKATFEVEGKLLKLPGQNGITATVAPAVYIPMSYLEQTNLIKRGSRINYLFYYKLEYPQKAEEIKEKLSDRAKELSLRIETVKDRKERLGRAFENLNQFLNLVGFVALLLGCLGVASAIHIYVQEKIPSVAVLRCLGASGKQTFFIWLIQTAIMGFLGALVGAISGSLIQVILPQIMANILPVTVSTDFVPSAVLQGIGLGIITSILFALLPLISIRKISPLRTLRASYTDDITGNDPIRWAIYLGIVLFIIVFAFFQLDNLKDALIFTSGVGIAFGILAGTAKLLMFSIRKYFPNGASYVVRQSLSNLYRPNNQTLILMISIGLGTALITTLFFVQNILLNEVTLSAEGTLPNMVLFDIQSSQKEEVSQFVRNEKLPILQEAPIVTMRLLEVKGHSVNELKKDTTLEIPRWTLDREYRVTYRDKLADSETLTQGFWNKKTASGEKITAEEKNYWANPSEIVPISVEEDYAEQMQLKIGDKLTFDVQGLPIKTVVSSFRKVDWRRVQTNFLVIFPTGILETAPQFHVLMTRLPNIEKSADFQQKMVQKYPNISIVDIGLILQTLNEVLEQISFVIEFMALFSILTGLLVLSGSIYISKYRRIRENVLLRTLGASRSHIFQITLYEYLFLGIIASLSGILLAFGGSTLLSILVFETEFMPEVLPALSVFLVVTGLTVIIGVLGNRNVLNRPPAEMFNLT